ncbi:MAG TPA: OB-fold nucleic acid binding domain-containing protein, partial [Acidimicrobiales bacterium]|nr:OB-fold nucleic acid binding domain-containing protein [Acidimicrobiales bacterium]
SQLEDDWRRLGLSRLPLDVIDCPDRRLDRAALLLSAEIVRDGDTELTLLLPRRHFNSAWSRLLHDRTGDGIVATVGQLAHVNATIIPFQLSRSRRVIARRERSGTRPHKTPLGATDDLGPAIAGTTPIRDVTWRRRVRVAGRVKSVRVPTRAATAILECTLTDGTGAILLVFQGRRSIPGIKQGARLAAEGMVGSWDKRLAILNPDYQLIAGGVGHETEDAPASS